MKSILILIAALIGLGYATAVTRTSLNGHAQEVPRACIYTIRVSEQDHIIAVEWQAHPSAGQGDTVWTQSFRVDVSPNRRCIILVRAGLGDTGPQVSALECSYTTVIAGEPIGR